MSKRDEARDQFAMWITAAIDNGRAVSWDRVNVERIRSVVDLIIDAAKEEIRAELTEQAEEDRWHWMNLILGLCDGPQSPAFWEEYRALKAKREAAGRARSDGRRGGR
jgi:hypothetical protein